MTSIWVEVLIGLQMYACVNRCAYSKGGFPREHDIRFPERTLLMTRLCLYSMFLGPEVAVFRLGGCAEHCMCCSCWSTMGCRSTTSQSGSTLASKCSFSSCSFCWHGSASSTRSTANDESHGRQTALSIQGVDPVSSAVSMPAKVQNASLRLLGKVGCGDLTLSWKLLIGRAYDMRLPRRFERKAAITHCDARPAWAACDMVDRSSVLDMCAYGSCSAVQHGVGELQVRELEVETPSISINDWEDVSNMMTVELKEEDTGAHIKW